MGHYAGPKSEHICSHVHFGLRGCTRLKGHVEQGKDHYNMFSGKDGETWKDEHGMYCETQEDWGRAVDNLKGSNGKFREPQYWSNR